MSAATSFFRTRRNAFDGTPAELRGSDRIRRLYLGEDEGEPA